MADRLPTYYGTIKNYDPRRGLGFIDCQETKDYYEKDILVLRSQLGDNQDGSVVSFNIVEDARGVKAANVKLCPDGFPPGKEPKPRLKGKGFGKGKGKFEELWHTAATMLNEWGWYGDGWWDGWGGWDDPSWWMAPDASGKGGKRDDASW